MIFSRKMSVRLGYCTDTGRVREINEDSFSWSDPGDDKVALTKRGRLYVVADGMGGCSGGEIASELAVRTLISEYEEAVVDDIPTNLIHAIHAANLRIYEESMKIGTQGMGTTLICAVIHENDLLVGQVGDSRAYLVRNDQFIFITQDHTLVNEWVKTKIISSEEALVHPQRHILNRVLGKKIEITPQIYPPIKLQGGDRILLCTDGVSGYLDDHQILTTLQANPDPQDSANGLIQFADTLGGEDNSTALVIVVQKS
jgi:serine/threonine protein phosphatase PrpC